MLAFLNCIRLMHLPCQLRDISTALTVSASMNGDHGPDTSDTKTRRRAQWRRRVLTGDWRRDRAT